MFGEACREHQGEADGIKAQNPFAAVLHQQPRGGLYANQFVILAILMRIDRVVAQGPEEKPGIENKGGQIDVAGLGRKSQKRTPVEGKSQPGLRPPGDPLHERIGGHQQKRGDAQNYGEAVELQQDDQSQQGQENHKDTSAGHADGARGDGTAARARHLGIDLAVHDIVEGATGSPHDDGAKPEQHDIIKIAPIREGTLVRHRTQRQAADAGPEQQPGADRPVQAHQLQPGSDPARCRFDPIAGNGVGGGLRGQAHARTSVAWLLI